MYKCKLCGMEKETRRQIHGHLIVKHNTEYRNADYEIEKLADFTPPELKIKRDPSGDPEPKPEGFRYLKKEDPREYAAILEGLEFIDGSGFCYTREEARGEGWI